MIKLNMFLLLFLIILNSISSKELFEDYYEEAEKICDVIIDFSKGGFENGN